MKNYEILALRDRADLNEKAAEWFHEKWNVSKVAYLESFKDCQKKKHGVPQWYLVLNQDQIIIGGIGLIENDFHKRKDLSPNLCALFVEKAYRNNGIARALLEHVCIDTAKLGYQFLYLITNHDQLYEKFGWSYICMVEEDNKNMIRMYQRELSSFLESIPT